MTPAGTHPAIPLGILLGAEIPDIDVVVRYFGGDVAYLRKHRGPTHGLVVLPLEALAITVALRLVWPDTPLWPIFLWTLVGCLSHVISDFGNDYGTQGLWPFSRRWIAWDLIPIIDIWMLLIIGAGWALTGLLPVGRQAVFAGVWIALGLYVAARYALRTRAMRLVRDRFPLSESCGQAVPCSPDWPAERITLHPTLFSLNAWRYVVQEPDVYLTGLVWALPGRVGKPERSRNHGDRLVHASLQAGMVSAFAEWVRRPRVEVRRQRDLYEVRWSDMRYETDGLSPFTAYAWLDERLNVLDEGLSYGRLGKLDGAVLRRRLMRELGREVR